MRTTVTLDDEQAAHVEQLGESDESNAAVVARCVDRSQQLTDCTQERTELRERVQTLEAECERVDDLEAERDRLDDEVSQLRGELADARETVARLEGRLEATDDRLADKDAEIDRLQTTVESQAARISELTSMASALNERSTELQVREKESAGLLSRWFGSD